MAGIRGSVGAMVRGEGCCFTEVLKMLVVVQRLSSYSTVSSSPCSHPKISYFNSARVGKAKRPDSENSGLNCYGMVESLQLLNGAWMKESRDMTIGDGVCCTKIEILRVVARFCIPR